MKRWRGVAVLWVAALFISPAAVAADDPEEGFKLKPVMLDAKDGTGTVLGIDFVYQKSWEAIAPLSAYVGAEKGKQDAQKTGLFKTLCGGYAEDARPIPEWVRFSECAGDLSVRGTWAADSTKNPNKLLEVAGSYSRLYIASSIARTQMVAFGAQAKYETDQEFDDRQYVLGLRGTYTYLAGCSPLPCKPAGHFLGLAAGVQRVDPAKDAARQAVLGSDVDPYPRWEFEGFLKYNLPEGWNYLSDVELNYRHFQEIGPPDSIRQAGLHRQRLGLVRVNFGLGGKGAFATTPKMFVQYSRGTLPFDTRSERVVKVGLSFEVF